MEVLKTYIQEQIEIATIYSGKKETVLVFQERAFGAARLYDLLNNTRQGIQEYEKTLPNFEVLY